MINFVFILRTLQLVLLIINEDIFYVFVSSSRTKPYVPVNGKSIRTAVPSPDTSWSLSDTLRRSSGTIRGDQGVALFSRSPAAAGTNVRASTREPKMAATTVKAMGLNIFPSVPCSARIGT